MGREADERLLGVEADADGEALKAAFRSKALSCHPDLAGEESEGDFIRVRQAYERLRDGHWDRPEPATEVPRPPTPPVREVGRRGRRSDFVELFDGALAGLGPGGRRRKVVDTIVLEVPLDTLIFGATYSVRFPLEVSCRSCGGRGLVTDRGGTVASCTACRGSGQREHQVAVPLPIPPGLRRGQTLRVPLEPAGFRGLDLLVELELAAA